MILKPDRLLLGMAPSDQFGIEVSTAGDVNADGYADVLIGAFQSGDNDEGAAYVYFGGPDGLSDVPDWVYQHDVYRENFGRAVRSAGDVNGDGYDDIMIGAPTFTSDPADETLGSSYVFFGGPDGPSLTIDWSVTSPQFGDRFGRAVGGVGDVDGDGFDDIMVSGYFHDIVFENEGGLIVYEGSAAGPSLHHDWTALGGGTGAGLGWGAGAAGDVNGDGYADVLGGAPKFDAGNGIEGQLMVYYGSADSLPGTPSWTYRMGDSGSELGRSVGAAGDVNGDGYDDIIAGARNADDPAGVLKAGAALVFLGSAEGLAETPVWTTFGDHSLSFYGNYVAGIGDINGDGFDDIAVGSPGAQSFTGQVHIFLGSANGPETEAALVLEGVSRGSAFGFSVWGAGDTDGDGLDDMVVGSPFFSDNGMKNGGAAMIYTGATLTTAINYETPGIIAGTVMDETVTGTTADEMIFGHGGIDTISGGGGRDVFVIAPNSPVVIIEDFDGADDIVDFSMFEITIDDLSGGITSEGDLIINAISTEVVLRGIRDASQFNQDRNLAFYTSSPLDEDPAPLEDPSAAIMPPDGDALM